MIIYWVCQRDVLNRGKNMTDKKAGFLKARRKVGFNKASQAVNLQKAFEPYGIVFTGENEK